MGWGGHRRCLLLSYPFEQPLEDPHRQASLQVHKRRHCDGPFQRDVSQPIGDPADLLATKVVCRGWMGKFRIQVLHKVMCTMPDCYQGGDIRKVQIESPVLGHPRNPAWCASCQLLSARKQRCCYCTQQCSSPQWGVQPLHACYSH